MTSTCAPKPLPATLADAFLQASAFDVTTHARKVTEEVVVEVIVEGKVEEPPAKTPRIEPTLDRGSFTQSNGHSTHVHSDLSEERTSCSLCCSRVARGKQTEVTQVDRTKKLYGRWNTGWDSRNARRDSTREASIVSKAPGEHGPGACTIRMRVGGHK